MGSVLQKLTHTRVIKMLAGWLAICKEAKGTRNNAFKSVIH